MSEIKTFSFDKDGFEQINAFSLLKDWPVVYLIEDGKELYVGETTNALARSKQHFAKEDRARLERMHIILDEEYNKSAALDVESQLIQFFAAENKLKLQNGNRGLVNHNYFDKERYRARLESTIWEKLKELNLVHRDLSDIKNSEIFKYSPYKALSDDQLEIGEQLINSVKEGKSGVHIVNGGPGTGKSVLATYLMKALKDTAGTKDLSIALVVPMSGLRDSIKKAFSYVEGLSESMVIGPSEVANKRYDLLIVDEAHRLRQRRSIVNYASHDKMNTKLGLGDEGTELDWILLSSQQQILFYDANQTVRPADVHIKRFSELNAKHYHLTTQLRIKGGDSYIKFVEKVFSGESPTKDLQEYDFQIFDDVSEMVSKIKEKDKEMGLCRTVAGYAWDWVSRDNPDAFDIEIDGFKGRWNSRLTDWVNSPNAINEVGCIHTIQGYDLNYVGVIVGPELSYDEEKDKLVVIEENYKDKNGWRGINDPEELERYIINIYKTLLTRGMRGCYVYFVDKKVEKYFRKHMQLI